MGRPSVARRATDESYIRQFIPIGSTDRSIGRRLRDIAALAELVKNISTTKDGAAQRVTRGHGKRHAKR